MFFKFSLGDGHSTSVEYERKTLGERGSILVCSGSIFRLMPAAQSCCSEKLLWASEDLTKGASSEDPKIPVLVSGWRGGLRVTKERHFPEQIYAATAWATAPSCYGHSCSKQPPHTGVAGVFPGDIYIYI